MSQVRSAAGSTDAVDVVLRVAVVALALSTAYIHSTLGGLLFTLNAVGYATLAVALVVPLAIADRFRVLARLTLLGFAASTIGGWVLFGARYDMGYIATGIEVVLIAVLMVDTYRVDGGPIAIARRLLGIAAGLVGLVTGRRARYAGA